VEKSVHPKIASLARYAAELAGPDLLPKRDRAAIDLMRLSELLDSMFLMEITDSGHDYYFKYWGELLPGICGANLCGTCLSEVNDIALRRTLKKSYDKVVEGRVPVYSRGFYVWPDTKVPVERLLIPLAGDNGKISAVCGIIIAGLSDRALAGLIRKGNPQLVCHEEMPLAA